MRLEKLDMLRGIAIITMVLFHFNYSLVYIFDINMLNFSELFWYLIGRISALLFIFISGISFFLAEKKYGKGVYKKYWKYSCILTILAGIISLSTYLFSPEQYIRFGILHFFALSFFLLPFFSKLRYINIFLGVFIIIYGLYFLQIVANQHLYWLGFAYLGFNSADYYPLIPYFGVLLLGYSLGLFLDKFGKLMIFQQIGEKNKLEKILVFSGKKSLLIYLVHQPIIIGIITVFELI